MDKKMEFKVDEEMYEQIREIAHRERVSIATIIRRAIERELRKEGKKKK